MPISMYIVGLPDASITGGDMLDVAATVMRNGETLRTFDTWAGGLIAGLVTPSAFSAA